MLGGGRFGNQTDRRDQFMTSAGEKITTPYYLSLINSSTGKNEAKNGGAIHRRHNQSILPRPQNKKIPIQSKKN
jgi:hypothetical protein